MHEYASFNHQIISSGAADIPAVSSAALYGKGVFTTVAIHGGKPFLWEKHWARLMGNAAKLGIDISGFTKSGVAGALADLISKNGVETGRARVTFFDERCGGTWVGEAGRGTSLLIVTGNARPVPEHLRLTVSPYLLNSRSPLTGVKSCNYLENLIALEEARSRGFDEAVRLNEHGDIASGCMANIFWRKDGRFFTPQLITGCLPGTTRELFIEKTDAAESIAVLEELQGADAIMLTSAGLGVVEVREFEGRKFQTGVYDLAKIMRDGE